MKNLILVAFLIEQFVPTNQLIKYVHFLYSFIVLTFDELADDVRPALSELGADEALRERLAEAFAVVRHRRPRLELLPVVLEAARHTHIRCTV